jgi:hypothetical protein
MLSATIRLPSVIHKKLNEQPALDAHADRQSRAAGGVTATAPIT